MAGKARKRPPLITGLGDKFRDVSLSDSGSGSDTPRIAVSIADSCSGADNGSLSASVSLRDSSRGIDPNDVRDYASAAIAFYAKETDASGGDTGGKPAPKPEGDRTAYRPAKEFVGLHRMDTHTKLVRFLKDRPEIRTFKPAKNRLTVHAGDWHAYWSKQSDADFAAMDTDAINAVGKEQRQAEIRERKKRVGEPRRKR